MAIQFGRKKMKKVLLGLSVCLLLASLASADLMMTACPLGKGKWNYMPGAMIDFNYASMGGNAYMMMDAFGYGLNDKLDLYAATGVGYSAKTGMMNAMSMNSYALNLKYTVLAESLTQPFSLAINGGIKSMPMSMTSMNQMQGSLGLIVSKMTDRFNPYAGVAYRTTRQSYGDFSQVDYTIGTGIGPMDKMLMIEYTLQLMSVSSGSGFATLVGGNHYSSSQIAIGACFGLN
jgi:hypothetical protein